jgi:hypothetical protein
VAPGGTVLFKMTAMDPEGAALTFSWTAATGTLGTPTSTASSSEVAWTAAFGATSAIQATVTDASGAQTTQEFLVACPSCACETVFRDLFDRPDSDVIGSSDFPGQAWFEVQGDIDLLGGGLVMSSNAGINSAAGASHGGPLALQDGVRLRFAFRFDSSVNWVGVYFNAPATGTFNSATTGYNGLGVNVYGQGVPVTGNHVWLQEGLWTNVLAKAEPASLATGLDYYAELGVVGSAAKLTVATGTYASAGGSVVHTLSSMSVAGGAAGSYIKIGIDTNSQPYSRLLEVVVDRGLACGGLPMAP